MSTTVLAMCLVTAVLFAALATWLTMTRGNRISDILNSKGASSASMKAEVANHFKFETTIPIVALYGLAALIAIGPLLYWMTTSGASASCDSQQMKSAAVKRMAECYEMWHFSGRVTGIPARTVVVAAVNPPKLNVNYDDGSFNDDIPVRIRVDGEPMFPTITLLADGYEARTLYPGLDAPPQPGLPQPKRGNRSVHYDEIALQKAK